MLLIVFFTTLLSSTVCLTLKRCSGSIMGIGSTYLGLLHVQYNILEDRILIKIKSSR